MLFKFSSHPYTPSSCYLRTYLHNSFTLKSNTPPPQIHIHTYSHSIPHTIRPKSTTIHLSKHNICHFSFKCRTFLHSHIYTLHTSSSWPLFNFNHTLFRLPSLHATLFQILPGFVFTLPYGLATLPQFRLNSNPNPNHIHSHSPDSVCTQQHFIRRVLYPHQNIIILQYYR
jgi:hypothetical protein